jgi:adenylyltransferase/sulfurtransferase
MPVVFVCGDFGAKWPFRPRELLVAERGTNRGGERGIDMAKVLIPTPLRQYVEKKDTVEAAGASVAEVLAALTAAHPDLRKQIFTDEGKLRSFVNVYVNDEDIRYLDKDKTAVGSGDTLSIVPSIAGGL